jgi:hypothetical protein
MTATDLPAGGTNESVAWCMLGSRTANANECRWSYPPISMWVYFAQLATGPHDLSSTFLRGAKSVMGTCGRCIPWFDAPRSYRGVKNEASHD